MSSNTNKQDSTSAKETTERKKERFLRAAETSGRVLAALCEKELVQVDIAALERAMAACKNDLGALDNSAWCTKSEKEGHSFGQLMEDLFDDEVTRTKNLVNRALDKGETVLKELLIPVECQKCGLKTHSVEPNGEKTPLTVQGKIVYGRCLACYPFEGYTASASLNLRSVTFDATTNDVEATSVRKVTTPTKEAILKHEAFRSTFYGRKFDSVGATIIQASSGRMVPCSSGLASTILAAYNGHHNLILRPDDVWQAILAQFSLFLKANAEALRDKIVAFQGQRELTVTAEGNLWNTDFGMMAARTVSEQIAGNIKDPSLVSWLLPEFTTTTANDRLAASICAMSAMQNYFKYRFELACGIPSVTLLGTVQDWQQLRKKIDGLLEFEVPGESHIKMWHGWLAFVADNLVQSSQGNADVKNFWDRVATHKGGGSGPRFVSGWVTAFCVWSDEGRWQGETKQPVAGNCFIARKDGTRVTHYTSDFPMINTNDLPSGVVSVPVSVIDNGGTSYDCKMFSGQFGMHTYDVMVAPKTDWCIATTTVPSPVSTEAIL